MDYCGGDEEAANDLVKKFLDRSLTSRLGIRLLVTHHLLLRQQIRTDKVGQFLINMSSIRISSSGYPKPVLDFFVNIWVNFLC